MIEFVNLCNVEIYTALIITQEIHNYYNQEKIDEEEFRSLAKHAIETEGETSSDCCEVVNLIYTTCK